MDRDGINGCGTNIAYAYFTTFMILISMVAMNLSVAAVIDGLSEARKDKDSSVNKENLNKFYELWEDYDPNATGFLSIEKLICLLYELEKPLGIG